MADYSQIDRSPSFVFSLFTPEGYYGLSGGGL